MRIIVIGGGASGMMFSVQYKKQNPNDEVIVFEKTQYVSWAGCPTPYYIADELSFSHVVLNSKETFIEKGIDVRINSTVTKVDTKEKYVIVNNEKITYDKLVLAVGARTRTEFVKDYKENLENIFKLDHAVDAVKIKEYIEKNNPKKGLIIGLGFIGIEMSETFLIKNIDTTVVEFNDKLLPVFNDGIREDINKKLDEKKVKILLNTTVKDLVIENNKVKKAILSNGNEIETDIVLVSTGINPNISFLDNQIETKEGKIVVDNFFKTNLDDVYAVGDAVYNKFIGSNNDIYAPFGDVANKHGMLLARHLSNKPTKWQGVLRSFSSSFFDLKFAGTGLTLEEALKLGYNAKSLDLRAQTENSGFASYKPIKMLIIYDEDRKVVLGAFACGYEAVAQFIDQIAIVIYLQTPIEEFIYMDFAYSPKNSTVWTPLLVLYRKVIK